MGVFSAKRGNHLEKTYVASAPQGKGFALVGLTVWLLFLFFTIMIVLVTGVKSGKTSRNIDISKITPCTSPPSRTFGLSSPPEDLAEKERQVHVEVEQVGEGGDDGAGGAGGDGRGKGVETEAESSETTPRHTIYTRHPPGARGGATSKVPQSHEFENIQTGSWDTHNPACDNLSNAPRWNLTQGSRMNDHANCQEFFNLSLPPAERLF
ncbi:hypothetical protein HanXRQr2_Chr07g0294541 [Helianthus annuus]|uniref:Uncharacterized protein n=1 Tax=Helianthus annuus TaxID=4232 RepID=A0A9K3NFH3_HELAN|nr:hypothetical protein HanXRQr2_Chr07g0294541 [Helianthus annuus]KAJ0563113.1 hypothetical protein HanHA89_Chr07g0259411 [Helianthus annuus]KAJ0904686.1 hypothetical protein HanPSC8_Chr07g0285151 [Helianthus annuus]